MKTRTIIQIILIVGALTIAWWAFQIALKLFVPLLIIAGAAFVWYKFIKPRK